MKKVQLVEVLTVLYSDMGRAMDAITAENEKTYEWLEKQAIKEECDLEEDSNSELYWKVKMSKPVDHRVALVLDVVEQYGEVSLKDILDKAKIGYVAEVGIYEKQIAGEAFHDPNGPRRIWVIGKYDISVLAQ